MSKTEFTPGPWSCHPSAFMADGDDKRAYFIVSGLGFSGKTDVNAHLIVAAPDLYQALQSLLAIIADSDGVSGYHLNGDIAEWGEFDEIGAAIAALAKARGEQP